jgi:hypothetical protein
MLKIFEQIFRLDTRSSTTYPDELVHRATERAIDATDPRIRILSSYEKKMRPAVIHAIHRVVNLVDELSAPVLMSDADCGAQSIMGTLFSSKESLRSAIASDCACRDFRETETHVAEPVTALLLAQFSQKNTFGYDLVGDRTVADVPLTVVSFDDHRLIGLATEEAETRRLLQLRAFDYLLMLGLTRITEVKEHRQDLMARKRLLKAKLDIVSRSSGNLTDEPRLDDLRSLQQRMDKVEADLREAGAEDTVLQRNLDIVVATLATAEERLWLEKQVIYVDNMHYLRSAEYSNAVEFPLQMLRDTEGRAMAAQMVEIPPGILAGR